MGEQKRELVVRATTAAPAGPVALRDEVREFLRERGYNVPATRAADVVVEVNALDAYVDVGDDCPVTLEHLQELREHLCAWGAAQRGGGAKALHALLPLLARRLGKAYPLASSAAANMGDVEATYSAGGKHPVVLLHKGRGESLPPDNRAMTPEEATDAAAALDELVRVVREQHDSREGVEGLLVRAVERLVEELAAPPAPPAEKAPSREPHPVFFHGAGSPPGAWVFNTLLGLGVPQPILLENRVRATLREHGRAVLVQLDSGAYHVSPEPHRKGERIVAEWRGRGVR